MNNTSAQELRLVLQNIITAAENEFKQHNIFRVSENMQTAFDDAQATLDAEHPTSAQQDKETICECGHTSEFHTLRDDELRECSQCECQEFSAQQEGREDWKAEIESLIRYNFGFTQEEIVEPAYIAIVKEFAESKVTDLTSQLSDKDKQIAELKRELSDLKYGLDQEWEHESNVSANAHAAVMEAVEKYTDKNMNFTRDYLRPAFYKHNLTIIHIGHHNHLRREILDLKSKLQGERAAAERALDEAINTVWDQYGNLVAERQVGKAKSTYLNNNYREFNKQKGDV